LKELIKKILYPLDRRDILKLSILLFLTILSASFDFLGIALIIPLLTLLSGIDYTNTFVQNFVNLEDDKIIVIILIVMFIVFFSKFIIQSLLVFYRNNFSQKLFVRVSDNILKNYLYMNFTFHIKNNSSTLIRNVGSEASLFCNNIIKSILKLFSDFLVFISLATLLIIYNPKVALISLSVLFFFGMLFFYLTNKKIKEWGKIRQQFAGEVIKDMQQSFFGIREIIIFGAQKFFLGNYSKNNIKFSKATRNRDTLNQLPKGILEFIGVSTFIILIFYLLKIQKDISEIIVIIGVFAAAITKLLPSVTSIISNVQLIKFNAPVIDVIYSELNLKSENNILSNDNEIFFNSKIKLKNLSFKYPTTNSFVLNNLNFEIQKRDKISITGETGSGKTTLINLLTGLIQPTSGNVVIDEVLLNKDNVRFWMKKISYVPQNIYLSDESIVKNITFGENKKIDTKKIDRILKIVDLYDFVNSLPDKHNTNVGEKGAKISGGQSQRLGLARALYRDFDLIILDEATNSLDSETENKILDKFYDYCKEKTVISITHNKENIKHSNKLINIHNGKII
tara:strand:+ start:125 stop:1822 length:1698 start_codon:yes stop_codon:yes gene_type:complete